MQQTRNKMTISIVIPAYNAADDIQLCLESIAGQTILPDEVIVVNNNSNDATDRIAQSYPFVRVINEKQQGIVFARNAGFNAADSDIIARIDSDTVLPINWVEIILAFYRDPHHENSVFTGGCYFYNLRSGRLTGRIYDFVVHYINRVLTGSFMPWGSNCAFPATAWQAVRGAVCVRADVHEDLDIGLHFKQHGYETVFISHLRVGAVARRVVTEHDKLWYYITMWPHTLRLHNIKTWPIAWLIGLATWIGTYSIIAIEWCLKSAKKRLQEAATEV